MIPRTIAAAGVAAVLASACASTPEPGGVARPVFSDPTAITNPYYPIATTAYAVRLGEDAGRSARIEVAVLPQTKTIRWSGRTTQTVVAHFAGYIGGELVETTYDYFAQADDGGVYYFGEDVTNYRNGKATDHDGTWLAGRNGAAPGLIMPGAPAVGDVYYPERLPGGPFERDEIISVGEHVETALGSFTNGLKVRETLRDGSVEHKIFVPGIGIHEETTEDEQLRTVLHANTGEQRALPARVHTMQAAADRLALNARRAVGAIGRAWDAYAPQAAADGVPDAFANALEDALAAGRSDANELRAAVLDIVSVFRPGVKIDLARLAILAREMARAAGARQSAAASMSVAAFQAVWERALPFVQAATGDQAPRLEAILGAQRRAVADGDLSTLMGEARSALELIEEVQKELQ